MRLLAIFFLVLSILSGGCEDDPSRSGGEVPSPLAPNTVRFTTSMGSFDVELYREQAPVTVDNFLAYVDDHFYDNLLIHRVIADFMIQGGGFTTAYLEPPTRGPIVNEANNGLSNLRGTIAMARTSDPHSATSQFFINLKDNIFLDFKSEIPQGWGYAVFGRVVAGMDVVDAIGIVQTGVQNDMNDVPITPVVIEKIRPYSPWYD